MVFWANAKCCISPGSASSRRSPDQAPACAICMRLPRTGTVRPSQRAGCRSSAAVTSGTEYTRGARTLYAVIDAPLVLVAAAK